MGNKKKADNLMDKLISLCKRRGFVYPSSEIYGGLSSCWDYGSLGAELKRNLKNFWWDTMTNRRDDIEGLDSSILMHPQVWHTSGHVDKFNDPFVDCKKCKARFRADKLEESVCPLKPSKSPLECDGELTEVKQFNLMFKTFMGPVEESGSTIYIRPETAQGIYVNFLNVKNSSRQKIPFGIAQIGKAFRNEITPGNFIFRTREFEQMEMQYFVYPGEDKKWLEYWRQQRWEFYLELGINEEKLRWHEHKEDELAHYAKAAYDIEYLYPFGWQELEGVHNRTDYDLTHHADATGKDLRYHDDQLKEKFIPYIVETSAGCDRTILTILIDAYDEVEVKGEKRVFLRLSPKISPIKVAVFPLVKKDGMPEFAEKVYHELKKHFKAFYDVSGAIGRRYARMDEAGCPFCVTVDGQTMEDETMTVRDRDSMEQQRMKVDELVVFLKEKTSI
ncbi:MAG: glycine--tRNA ligase [candidate division Zixibacteria bacterium]|nr:glycine--tRNA ligase [candidate division Zixibacteria bacterium]